MSNQSPESLPWLGLASASAQPALAAAPAHGQLHICSLAGFVGNDIFKEDEEKQAAATPAEMEHTGCWPSQGRGCASL